MADHSFDIASQVDLQEVLNAVNQANKEIETRYDLKDTQSSVDFRQADHALSLNSVDEFKMRSIHEILKQKLIKRGISLKAIVSHDIQKAAGNRAKQELKIQQGLSSEQAKEVVKDIKNSKMKVQAQIQGDHIRVSAKKIDDLQGVIHSLKEKNYPFHLEYINYR